MDNELKMRICVSFRGSKNIRSWETGELISKGLERLGHSVDRYGCVYETGESITSASFGGSYDLFLWMECNDNLGQYSELKNINAAKKIGWFFDVTMYPGYCYSLADHMGFDHIFCANQNHLTKFSQPTTYLPYAADPELHFRAIEEYPTVGFGLVGSDRPERRELIQKLMDAGFHDAALMGGVFKEEYIDCLSQCRVTVNDQAGGGAGLLPMRTFEAPAAGSLLVELSQNENLLSPIFGDSYVDYNDLHDLIKVCRTIQNNPELVSLMRWNAQQKIREAHLYDHRAQTILDTIS